MHIPDGFLDARTSLATAALATTGVGLAVARLSRLLPERRVPAVGLAAAFVFAAQMLNFPVGAGTSGHLVGAALATGLLGAGAAVLVMTSVLVLQCFLFADGGLTALGANVFNMALVAPYGGDRRLVARGPGHRPHRTAPCSAPRSANVVFHDGRGTRVHGRAGHVRHRAVARGVAGDGAGAAR